MTETPQLSGKDLARQALAAYKATARTAPANAPAKTRRKRVTRPGDGRDPVRLSTALQGLGADLPMDAGVAGGSVIDQWPTLCPQYVGFVEPAGYDPATGRLDLRPSSPAYASQLRLLGGQLAKQINDKMGKTVVRTIRVLPVGQVAASRPTADIQQAARPEGPVKTRETASPGYRAAREAALAYRPERQPTNPYVVEAMQRQEAALRANRQPEAEHTDAHWASQPTGPEPGSVDESLARARAYARSQAAGRTPRRAFDAA
ncbi:DUF721 domain-containing protein [Streptomyces griseosporeus]